MTTIKCSPQSLRDQAAAQLDAIGRAEGARRHAFNCIRELLEDQPNTGRYRAAAARLDPSIRDLVRAGATDAEYVRRLADWFESKDNEIGKGGTRLHDIRLPGGRSVPAIAAVPVWASKLDPNERQRGGTRNAAIVAAALAAVPGTVGGECRVWVAKVLQGPIGTYLNAYRVANGTAPNEYHMAFEQAGAVSIDPSQAIPGDVIQLGEREVYVKGKLQMPLHTAIVVETKIVNGQTMLRLAESNVKPPFGHRVSTDRWVPASIVKDDPVTGRSRVWRLP